ncbi:RnfH family protein [Methylobacillus flagellatus]|uniref:UPF0125 protein Mfla_1143 n=1 Tax=Methylobacillus flagellatus (strain ATCC 51484 / DSM 6875 / VKM B-1610 / KT) TaxID=265072 RepID=Q1H276_METFK|nr:RnfH family protein [Methylobacillus flagellatus]ABE49411.1 protein of unknown function UPF0125 [Methylobacillus flagellatus KT]
MSTKFSIEVAYALPSRQLILKLEVEPGTTAIEAARQSGIADHFEGLDIDTSRLGIFGKQVAATTLLQAGDRVEIYRPLQADPKMARRNRVKQQGASKIRHKTPSVAVRTR